VLAAVTCGAGTIVAIDILDEKLRLARELGATHTVNARAPDAVEQVKDIARGGVDYAIDLSGSVSALELAYRVTRRGGTTVTAGLPNPRHTFALPPVSLVAEERTLKGSYIGSCVPSRDVPRFIALYRAGKLPVNKLMSRRIALEDINAAFDHLAAGEAIRQIIVF
jgi:alcohol dehydrogenase